MDNKPTSIEIDNLLSADPLSIAEEMTGESYKNSELTSSLGMILHFRKNEMLKAAMKATNDTMHGSTLTEYLAVVNDLGFEQVFHHEFIAKSYGDECADQHFIYARRDGILLQFDTFGGRIHDGDYGINGGHFYYNWKPHNKDVRWSVTSSGGFRDPLNQKFDGVYRDPVTRKETPEYVAYQKEWSERAIWVGYHDCREALRFNIRKLELNGEFVSPWIERPFFWLYNWAEQRAAFDGRTHDEGAECAGARTEEIVRQLPKWVREMIGPAR